MALASVDECSGHLPQMWVAKRKTICTFWGRLAPVQHKIIHLKTRSYHSFLSIQKKRYTCALKNFSVEKLLLLKVHITKIDILKNIIQIIKIVWFKTPSVIISLFALKDEPGFFITVYKPRVCSLVLKKHSKKLNSSFHTYTRWTHIPKEQKSSRIKCGIIVCQGDYKSSPCCGCERHLCNLFAVKNRNHFATTYTSSHPFWGNSEHMARKGNSETESYTNFTKKQLMELGLSDKAKSEHYMTLYTLGGRNWSKKWKVFIALF